MTEMAPFTVSQKLQESPPPVPLPQGWVLKESRSQPGVFYYFHQDTGVSKWEAPITVQEVNPFGKDGVGVAQSLERSNDDGQDQERHDNLIALNEKGYEGADSAGHIEPHKATGKRSHGSSDKADASSLNKKSRKSGEPKEVRVMHILKKHKDSRRPSSWRNAQITITKDQAREELQGLLEILQEEASNSLEDLQATFKDIARTESDCSSAKRGGDLGYFGRKKMQPAFEQAAFALEIGELSGIVSTNSGLHVLLRIG